MSETNEVFVDYEKYLKRYVLSNTFYDFEILILSQMGLSPPGKLIMHRQVAMTFN